MIPEYCACGFEATAGDELGDHLGEIFIPADDTDASGTVHAEAARAPGDQRVLACLCGLTTTDTTELDAHLLAVFAPPDGVRANGARHAPAGSARAS